MNIIFYYRVLMLYKRDHPCQIFCICFSISIMNAFKGGTLDTPLLSSTARYDSPSLDQEMRAEMVKNFKVQSNTFCTLVFLHAFLYLKFLFSWKLSNIWFFQNDSIGRKDLKELRQHFDFSDASDVSTFSFSTTPPLSTKQQDKYSQFAQQCVRVLLLFCFCVFSFVYLFHDTILNREQTER